jgi:putative addiction module antidote
MASATQSTKVLSAKVTTVGNSTGIVLPREVLAKLKVEKGDTVFFSETPSGINLTAYDETVARQMETARRMMRKYRNVLRKLAE